eukprot:scaffold10709_cov90-Isochrysis_galbana.AAC.3
MAIRRARFPLPPGECESNIDYMFESCRYSCGVCSVNFKKECRRNPAMSPAAVTGTVDSVFREAVEKYTQ